ncbi:MAG: hypothetical protein MJZ60_02430 [Bacteroidaceae bacterium]|nr:hypothetical protein [Bacteroidaceae bacterium]
MVKRLFLVFMTGVLLLVSCGKREAKDFVDALPAIFPDYTEVTVPHTIAPLNFGVTGATHVQAYIRNNKGKELLAEADEYLCIDPTEWHELLEDGTHLEVEVSVWDDAHPDGATYRPFGIHISSDDIDPNVTYRLIPPGYEGWQEMGIYERNMSNYEVKTLVDNANDRNGCMNCHTPCQGDGNTYVYHLRGEQGATIVHHDGTDDRIDLRALTQGRHGSHPAWHPSQRWIAFSSNDTKQIFYARSKDKIEAFDLWSDLFIYDVKNKRALLDERFTDSLHWESYPCFSPDGRWLYFSTARAVHMPEQACELHYDLVRVPFDAETGQLGATVDTLYSTSQRGGTALIPRVSPDGRYLLYTVAEYGAFNLYHKEADLEMIRIATPQSEAEGMEMSTPKGAIDGLVDCSAINSDDAESYHAWSSNGRWMLFSSKRTDGRYTRLFIAHWDGERWGKPFMLPQQDVKLDIMLMMAYNVAEFRK